MNHSRILGLAFGVFSAVAVALHFSGFPVTAENHLIENAQLAVLLIAVGLLARSLFCLAVGARSQEALALLAMGLVLVSVPLAGAGREVNFGRMLGTGPDGVDIAKKVFGFVVLLLIIGGFGLWFVRVKNRWQRFRAFIAGPVCRPVYASVVVFILASLFEKGVAGLPPSMLLEELAELATFLLILVFTLRFGKKASATATPASPFRIGAGTMLYSTAVVAAVFLLI